MIKRSQFGLTALLHVRRSHRDYHPYKQRLISVLENERPYYHWGWGERRAAIRDLWNYPGDITPNQDMRLRAIYRQGHEGGTYQDFRRVLFTAEN